mgnify:CR=1 FL=1
MTKSQIEKFAVGYSSYSTDCVEEVLKVTNFDEDVAREILDDKEKTLAIWQNGTIMIDGITLCCGYDFAEDAFSKKIKIGYCPICGRKIVIKKPMNEWFTWKIGRGDIIENRNMNDLEQGKYDRYRDILDLLDEMEWGDINGMEWFKQ